MELTPKKSAEWLDCFEPVLEVLEVWLQMMAPSLGIAEVRTFEVHLNLVGGNCILATMVYNSDMLKSPLSVVVSLLSCWMGQGGSTGERLEMVPAKAGNYTLVVVVVVVEEINSWVAQIECRCLADFPQYYLMLPDCPLGIVMSQTAHPLEQYWFSSVEIRSSTSYVNKRWW